jgi:cyclic-di-GMP phosphodiesterase TipF (flagellum assembly factor)
VSRRIESITVGAAIVAVAAAVWLILWTGLDVNRSYAGLAAIACAVALVLIAARTRRTTGEAETQRRLSNVERAIKRVDARFVELSARIAEIDQKAGETGRATARAVSAELDSIARVVRDLAETVAQHDAEITNARPSPDMERPLPAQTRVVAERGPRPPEPVAAEPPASEGEQPAPGTPPGPVVRDEPPIPSDVVVRAIVGDRLSLFLQPAVGLASRKVQLYEILGRVSRPGSSGHVQARDVVSVAVRHGLLGRLETLLVRDALRVARHLRSRGRDVPVLVPVSLPTLADPALYEILEEGLRGDPQLAGGIALQIRQEQWDQLGGLEEEAVAAIRRLGARFAVDDVRDLRLDVGELVRHGARYVRANAGVLLAAAEGSVPSDIHPHDVPGLLSRHGVDMIVTGVEQERTLVELFEFGLQFGQGDLFSVPRAVRPDVLADATERAAEPAPAAAAPGEVPAVTETVVEKPEAPAAKSSFRSVLRRSGA